MAVFFCSKCALAITSQALLEMAAFYLALGSVQVVISYYSCAVLAQILQQQLPAVTHQLSSD